jgi:large conductance mechanosensitive channel
MPAGHLKVIVTPCPNLQRLTVMLNEFKKFILKGNVIDLSTGVIIGAAFSGIVTAFTKGFVEPIIKFASGGTDPNVTWKLGIFDLGIIINAVIGFLITAAVIFFIIIKPMNKLIALTSKKEEAATEAAPPPADIALLTEIRDLLKK